MFNVLFDFPIDINWDAAGEMLLRGASSLVFGIDRIVYSFIPKLYGLIVSLANVDLYTNNDAISALMNRVYILVGIFMLFKLAFSIITYIIDPNAFSDQAKGFTNLVKRVLIALVLLILTPWLFSKTYELQGIVLNSNILPNLILGMKDDGVSSLESAAIDVQFLVFSPFFTINPVGELDVCKGDGYPLANILGSTDMALVNDGECLDAFAKAMDNDDSVKASGVTINQFFKDGSTPDNRSFGAFGSLLFMKVNDGENYAIDYLAIASTICGGYLVFLLLSFCIDIAARAIKLMFLQILSPIAFITSIDPTSSSGNDKLKDWGKECLTTFLSLFLRLAVVYLVIQIVKVITSKMFSNSLYYEEFVGKNNGAMNIFVYIFLVLGAFQVAKKMPELIEKAVGIKMSGELSLNPFKSPTISAFTGMGVGALAGGLSGFKAGVEAGAPVRGVLGGVATGMSKGFGTKPGVGMFGDLRHKTYKDMTGSELKTFNPLQKLYGFGGEKKVKDMKEIRNTAYDQINNLDTKLSTLSRVNAERRIQLSNRGIDKNAEQFEKMMSIDQQIEEHRKNVANLRKQREALMKQGKGMNSQEVREVNAQIAKSLSLEQKAYSEFNNIGKQFGINGRTDENYISSKNIYTDYEKGVEDENKLRSERSKIEKDIETINDQISDMRQFYHVDESTKQSVDEAISNIAKRKNEK